MGASFTNFQVRARPASKVSKALEPLVEARAYVSPEKGGWVTVYDEASESSEKAQLKIAAGLSEKLGTVVFLFSVYDSDMAIYWLYQNGVLVDEFDSAPDFFKKVSDKVRQRVRGDAEKLFPLCVPGTSLAQVEEVIHPTDSFPLMAEDIVIDLAKLLGIDETRADLGFTYFDEEGEEMLDDASDFAPIGKGASRKEEPSREADEEPSLVNFDTFALAIGMMTKCWTAEHEKMAKTLSERFRNQFANMADQLSEGADRGAQSFLKRSKLPGAPTFKELKAARDQGPDALAKLLIQRVPTQLGCIADGAIGSGLESFVAALLANGMDPNIRNQHGDSLLTVALKCEKPTIHNLLRLAIQKKS